MEQIAAPEDVASGMSLSARLANVFATPGEVFDDVRARPREHANWWMPLFFVCLTGLVSVMVVFSQPAVIQELQEQRLKAMAKQFAKMPPAQRQQVMQLSEKMSSPTLLKLSGIAGVLFWGVVGLFLAALIVWVLGMLFFEGQFNYWKALEACGLASMILVLGKVIAMLLAVITGHANVGLTPALLLSDFDPTNPGHLVLSSLNLITFWYLTVLSIALAKLSRVRVLRPMLCIFGLWAFFQAGFILLAFFVQQLMATAR